MWFYAGFLLFMLLARLSVAKTVRYRSGQLQGGAIEERVLTVPAARQHCMHTPSCVAFSFMSAETRFPIDNVRAFFFPFADWHVMSGGEEPAFFEDVEWHTYVNTTREIEQVSREVTMAVDQLMGSDNESSEGSKLRGNKGELTTEAKLIILDALFHVTFPKEHKLIAAPLLLPPALLIATSATEIPSVRQSALVLITVIADSAATGELLIGAGVFESMRTIVTNRKDWDETVILALDVVSNMCLYRSVNDNLKQAGVQHFLHELLPEGGFAGLQAAMALTHLEDEHLELPDEKLDAFVELLRNTIDGDIAYGVKWDLLPGPLSALKYLVLHSSNRLNHDQLLNAGIIEELLRILGDDCLVAAEVEAALEILQGLALISERARHMILLAEDVLIEATGRLKEYHQPTNLAKALSAAVAGFESGRSEL